MSGTLFNTETGLNPNLSSESNKKEYFHLGISSYIFSKPGVSVLLFSFSRSKVLELRLYFLNLDYLCIKWWRPLKTDNIIKVESITIMPNDHGNISLLSCACTSWLAK